MSTRKEGQLPEFAPVAPIHVHSKLRLDGYKGKYHLLLAHDVVQHPNEYYHLFNPQSQVWDNTDMFVIMDNSVIELGEPVGFDVMKKACEIVKPKVVVLPDHLRSKKRTLLTCQTLSEDYCNLGIPLMGVPQGQEIGEIADCVYLMQRLIPISYWGVAKWMGDYFGSRMLPLYAIWQTGFEKPAHMLGFSSFWIDDLACARIPGVMGIDSSMPITLGLAGHEISLDISRETMKRIRPKRNEAFEMPYHTNVWHNIVQVNQWLESERT